MHNDAKEAARDILTRSLERKKSRKTPERYAILDAVYSMDGIFTLEELNDKLALLSFQVSRATLYNTLRLLVELRLVIRHRFQMGTRYEACLSSHGHCHQICTVCGKVTDVDMPEVSAVLDAAKFKRFRSECYSLYVYGMCTACSLRQRKAGQTGAGKEKGK